MLPTNGPACPLCGTPNVACGHAGTTSTPVDVLIRGEVATVATDKYRVTVNGHETVMKLSAEDAKAYPDARLFDEPAPRPAEPTSSEKPAASKTRTAADKSRRPSGNKTSN